MKNIIFIDWDDTLFPTTWINNNSIDCKNKEDINKYKLFFLELDKSISNLLEILTDNNDNAVYIVTNANKKWVELCLLTLPNTSSIIDKDVTILSAKDIYNQKTNSMMDWKILTFKDIVNDMYINNVNINNALEIDGLYASIHPSQPSSFIGNVISIGDSNYEYTALLNLYDYLKNNGFKLYNTSKKKEKEYLLKNIKLVDKPEFDIIINQLYVLKKNINGIIEQKNVIDILLEPMMMQ
jgi:hypothetical protein